MARIISSKRPRRLYGWLRRKYLKARVKEKEVVRTRIRKCLNYGWHERETCINNLNVSSTKADYIRSIKTQCDQLVWRSNKSSSQNRAQNNSKDKYARGSLDNVSRISWEERNLDEQSTLRRTRSFAISRENLFYSLDYTETSENHRRRAQLIPRAKLIEKSFIRDSRYESIRITKKIPSQPAEIPPDYSPLPSNNSLTNYPLDENIYDIPPIYTTRNNSPFTEHKEDIGTELETKISDSSRYRKSLEDLVGLSLPHYYPDSELTDNISITDNQSTFSQDKARYISLDNLRWSIGEEPESISYDENIVLTKKTEGLYAKPRTIRGPTPYHRFDYRKLPQFNSDQVKDGDKAVEATTTEQHSSIEFETNTNCDEIKLNNEIIDKIDVSLPVKPGIELVEVKSPNKQIKTLIEVCAATNLAQDSEKSDDFKSIVAVDGKKSEILESNEDETKNHSHNYLKEFLESQKGSKKPLQSFLAKKFSNLTRKHSKSNLVSNQFYSLPDITASKNLHKCEKIDRKLRKCDKPGKAPEKITENRFIVNIGKHFDITAKSTVPVDFQVKIAKVPKKNKKQSKNKEIREKEFKEAVESVNSTLQNNGFSIDFNNNTAQQFSLEVTTTKPAEDQTEDIMDPEIQEKVDNMRNYWTKMVGNEKCDEEKVPLDCKTVEIQTKVNNVKKKFEAPAEDGEQNTPNKVQQAKKLFEPKPIPEKAEKISPTIKETCNYFEKHPLPRPPPKSFYESLSQNSVELVTQNDENSLNKTNNKPAKKSLAKSNSIAVPEFDHVRYKVIKPELFNKKILANCETEAQFDGLMQYLQDYSFQELLIDNNIVIIEPIRSKIPHHKSQFKGTKTSDGIIDAVPKLNEDGGEFDDVKQGIRKHFFYHPIRVNKEVNDNELPNPEVVRQARQFFEKGLVNLQSIGLKKERYRANSVDPDKDKCSSSSSHSTLSVDDDDDDDVRIDDNDMLGSLDNDCCTEYVSEDIMEKIREYGTTVTYYGGQVVNQHYGQPILTKVIMEEIKNNEKRCMECSGCRRRSIDRTLNEVNNEYQGIKFKLVKSNSCSSRLELVGAARKKNTHRKTINKTNVEKNNNTIKEINDDESNVIKGTQEYPDKNAINETIKLSNKLTINSQPRIIGEERKMAENNKYIQWSEIKKDQTYASLQFKEKTKIKNYDYNEKVRPSSRQCDMEFEPYEVA